MLYYYMSCNSSRESYLSTTSQAPLINLQKVMFTYPGGEDSPVLNIPEWQISEGENVFIVGSSGSGKSTLLKIISGLLSPTSGKITVAEQSLESMSGKQLDQFRANQLGYVAQSFNLIPYLSALENIHLARYFTANSKNKPDSSIDVEALLSELNITSSHWHKSVEHLSAGQQQRVAIARAMANKPKILIADEPTSSLDQGNRDAFMDMLMSTADAHDMTLVFVSHDLSLGRHFHRVDLMSDFNNVEGDA